LESCALVKGFAVFAGKGDWTSTAPPQAAPLTLDSRPFAVIDIETTGFSPAVDRMIEVAIRKLTADGVVEDEYATLINPQQKVEGVYVHGLRTKDVLGAPTFTEIAGDIELRLKGAVLVAHNAPFEWKFLNAEFARTGFALSQPLTLCTLWMSYMLDPNARRHRLADCCKRAGVDSVPAHDALSDAKATCQLLLAYLAVARKRGVVELRALGCKMPLESDIDWPTIPTSGRTLVRQVKAPLKPPQVPYLARLALRLKDHGVTDPDVAAYAHLLDHVLQDRRVSEAEAEELFDTAEEWGLDREQAAEVNLRYLEQLVATALDDGFVTVDERRDLDTVCKLLAVAPSVLDALISGGAAN
jgi:DNA polymerase-3 subunit epsilon